MNDMDALFRKAAKGYPLRAGDGDWENISGKLLTKPAATSPASKNNRKKYFGRLLILLFLVTGGSMIYFKFPSGHIKQIQVGNSGDALDKNTEPFVQEGQKPVIKAKENDQPDHIKTLEIPKEKSDQQLPAKDVTFSKISGENNFEAEFISSANRAVTFRLISLPGPIVPDKNISVFEGRPLPGFRADDATESLVETLSMSKGGKRKVANINNRGLYFGLTAGPDFSNVKFQAINKTGYNLGLLAGYRFNRKISVESGIFWGRKKYYSDGKHFSMSKVGSSMPSSMKIMTVDGQLTVLEIPLKLKYDFVHKKRSNMFISAGISSNICLKERNNYLTEINGLQEYHIGLYKDILYCPISLISISAGYEHGLGKSRTLRLEPYIKIPLKKVGMGSMPVFSTGINVGISSLFSKGRP
jgi:hypothetical protein